MCFDSFPDPACIVKIDSEEISYVNSAFGVHCVKSNRATKMKLMDFFQSDTIEAVQAAIRIACTSNVSELSSPVRMGRFMTLTLYGDDEFPVFKEFEWSVVRISANHLLLSGRKINRLRKSLSRLEDFESELVDCFANAPIALHWLSGTGTILWANKKELDTLGYTAEEYIGHSVLEFCPDEKVRVLETFRLLSAGATIKNVPFKFRKKSGDIVYLVIDSNVSYHQDGSFKNTRCFIRDDTARQIHEAAAQLEKEAAKANAIAKDAFCRRIFHELRTPVHSMQSVLLEESRNSTVASFCNKQVEIIAGMIEDFVHASYYDRGDFLCLSPKMLRLSPFLAMVSESAFNRCGHLPYIKDSAVEIDLPNTVPKGIIADESLLNLIFSALLSNALTHGTPLEKVYLKVRYDATSNTVTFEVSNAISRPVDLEKIAKHCRQMYHGDFTLLTVKRASQQFLDSLSSKQGIGLGLFIASKYGFSSVPLLLNSTVLLIGLF